MQKVKNYLYRFWGILSFFYVVPVFAQHIHDSPYSVPGISITAEIDGCEQSLTLLCSYTPEIDEAPTGPNIGYRFVFTEVNTTNHFIGYSLQSTVLLSNVDG